MKFTIDEETIINQGYSLNDIIGLFCLEYTQIKPKLPTEVLDKLLAQELVVIHAISGELLITPIGRSVLNTITFYKKSVLKRDLKSLAKRLQELFPEGRKGNTAYYWRGSAPEIERKLEVFTNKYPKIKDEDIIQATHNYVKSFKGEFMYMQLLKYFIEKDGISSLLSSIENKDAHHIYEKEDWTSNLM